MFPTLRLIVSASFATMILVALVGSGMVLFMAPPVRLAAVSEIVRPVTTANNDMHPAPRFDDRRRMHELQRLLSLPPGPRRAYAAEPPTDFPYVLETAKAEAVTLKASVSGLPETAKTMDAVLDTTPVTEPELPGNFESATTIAVPATVAEALVDDVPVGAAAVTPAEAPTLVLATAEPIADTEIATPVPTIDASLIPLPKPKAGDPGVASAPDAKPQAAKRAQIKARKSRSVAFRRVRKPLPPPTNFEAQQGQFHFFGYGNTWDSRTGWTTQVGSSQRSYPEAPDRTTDQSPATATPSP